MTDLTPDHPAVEAGAERFRAEMMGPNWTRPWTELGERAKRKWRTRALATLNAAIPHLTADDLPSRLVRDIEARTLRAAARAATDEEDGIPWDHDWDRATVSVWLDDLADNIEGMEAE